LASGLYQEPPTPKKQAVKNGEESE